MKKVIIFFQKRIWIWGTLGFLWESIKFVQYVVQLSIEMELDWWNIASYIPEFIEGVLFVFLLILLVQAKSDGYKLQEEVKNNEETLKYLHRLNQLYKLRFKMILNGDEEKLFSKDFERENWRKELIKRSPELKNEITVFVEENYDFDNIDYPT